MNAAVVPARRRLAACLAAAVALAAGCRKEAKLVPVAGVVRIGGRPAANIAVQFLPDDLAGEPRPTSFATTDSDGRFRLIVQGGKEGAVAGGHAVILADCDEDRPPQGQPMRRPPRLHGKYATISGNLRATVAETGGEVLIDVPAPATE